MDDKKSDETGLGIATIGSKNRVCLPPSTVEHMKTNKGDNLVFIHKFTMKDNKPYTIVIRIKPENFDVGEVSETVADVIKR